jgi:hypothetical protein
MGGHWRKYKNEREWNCTKIMSLVIIFRIIGKISIETAETATNNSN